MYVFFCTIFNKMYAALLKMLHTNFPNWKISIKIFLVGKCSNKFNLFEHKFKKKLLLLEYFHKQIVLLEHFHKSLSCRKIFTKHCQVEKNATQVIFFSPQKLALLENVHKTLLCWTISTNICFLENVDKLNLCWIAFTKICFGGKKNIYYFIEIFSQKLVLLNKKNKKNYFFV